MDGIGRALGAGVPLKLGDKEVLARPITLDCYAELEQRYLSLRPNPFLIAKQQFPLFEDDREAKEMLLRLAMSEATRGATYATKQEIAAWMDSTMDGFCFTAYLSLRDNDRELYTYEYVRKLLLDEYQKFGDEWFRRKAEIEQAINAAGGTDELGKSTGQAATASPLPTSDSPGGE